MGWREHLAPSGRAHRACGHWMGRDLLSQLENATVHAQADRAIGGHQGAVGGTTLKAVVYSRCSTDEDHQQVRAQHELCVTFCKAQGWDYDLIEEYASAWNKPREKFLKMIESIRLRQYQVIVCFDLDRFSRDDPHIADRWLNQIVHEWGCRFISLNDNIDSENEVTWHITRHIFVWAANKYSQRLSSRIKEGIKYKQRTEGAKYKHGRPRVADYERIRSLHSQGWSINRIARELGVSKGSVHRAVQKVSPVSI